MPKAYSVTKIEKMPKSEVDIEAEITAEGLMSYWPKAIKHLSEHAKIDGFREGKIPENILVSKIGEMAVLEEAAEIALAEIYPEIVIENKIKAIGRPKVTIAKLAKNSPVVFRIKTAVSPDFALSNYKKVANEIMKTPESIDVTEKEYDDFVKEIQKSRAPHVHAEGEEHKDTEELVLPEITDEFVKSLGTFEDVADFKAKVYEGIKQEKELRNREKRRLEILEKLVSETEIEVPAILIESEIDKMQSQFEENLQGMNISIEEYFKKINKIPEEVREEWLPEAEKRAKIQLILNQISVEEKIEPSKEEITAEINHLLEHYKDVPRERVRVYVETILTNEKVLQFLESQN
jgi:FKBP-type peptidyl-prolyl cis-trans isomerase (trigger factor)